MFLLSLLVGKRIKSHEYTEGDRKWKPIQYVE